MDTGWTQLDDHDGIRYYRRIVDGMCWVIYGNTRMRWGIIRDGRYELILYDTVTDARVSIQLDIDRLRSGRSILAGLLDPTVA